MVRRVLKLTFAVLVIGFLSFLTVEVGLTDVDTASQTTQTAVTASWAVPMACASEEADELPPCPECPTCTGGCAGCFGIECAGSNGEYCGMLRSQSTGEYTRCERDAVM